MSPLTALYIMIPVLACLFLRKLEEVIGVFLQDSRARRKAARETMAANPAPAGDWPDRTVRTLALCMIEFAAALLLTLILFSVPFARQQAFIVLWMTIAMVFVVRTVVQVVQAVRQRRYQPGMVVGILGLPLMWMTLDSFCRWYALWQVLAALVVGCVGFAALRRWFPLRAKKDVSNRES